LLLEPKKRRAKKRVDSVRFLVDRESMLPVRVEYVNKQGDRRIVEFFDVDVNGDIAASVYQVDIPADIEVSKGFTAFGGG
jgi:outer membrane lipoprotein-sorting protein